MISGFDEHFATLPVVAILRGITPDEVTDVASVLLDEGIRLIEVPLNSPGALKSITRLAAFVGSNATVGAGTVTTPDEVQSTCEAGGVLIVSPNCDPGVIELSLQLGLVPFPGFRTATEAFRAIQAGAQNLKFFPASTQTAIEISALNAVLPPGTGIIAVGGVNAENAGIFRASGAAGLGAGSSVYRPGKPLDAIRRDARALIESWTQSA